jgi:hypothetical protein
MFRTGAAVLFEPICAPWITSFGFFEVVDQL